MAGRAPNMTPTDLPKVQRVCLTCTFACICGFEVTRHTYVTLVSLLCCWSTACHSLRGAGPVCLSVCHSSCPTYPLSSPFEVLSSGRCHRGPDEHKRCFFPLRFSSSLSFSSHSSCSCSSAMEAAVVYSFTFFLVAHTSHCV